MKSWSAVFTAVFAMLLWRNRFLFSMPVHELGDSGANSIIVNQAKHFTALVGNYSRQGFNHPGPAYLYVQAAGEWLFHDVLRLVPTPWNGQMLALYALNAAMLATVALIIQRWFGSWLAAGSALLAMVGLLAYIPHIVTSPWMPFVYAPTFLLLLAASASVAAGRPRELWAMALAGSLLINGHAVFLLFVPVVVGVTLIVLLVRQRRIEARAWLPALVVLAALLAPIAINTLLHWPGEFGKYFDYGASMRAGSRSLGHSLLYVFWYWWPGQTLWQGLLGFPVVATVIVLAARLREPFVQAGLALSVLVSALLAYYAYAGIDSLAEPYMGFFYWSVPMFVLACLGARLGFRVAQRIEAAQRMEHHRVAPVVPFVLALAVVALVPGFRTGVNDDRPEVPEVLAALSRHAAGRPIVMELAQNDIGMELPGLFHWARREGLRVCLRDARWVYITTPEYVCTEAEAATGIVVTRWRIDPADPARPGEITRVGYSAFLRPTRASL